MLRYGYFSSAGYSIWGLYKEKIVRLHLCSFAIVGQDGRVRNRSACSNVAARPLDSGGGFGAGAVAAVRGGGESKFRGVWEGLLGVLIFAGTMPTMKIAVRELDPAILGIGRLAVAALPAAATLIYLRAPLPRARQFVSLGVAVLCFCGFAWTLAEALRGVSSHHAAIVSAAIPLVVALMAVIRDGERQPLLFWLATLTGAAVVIGYGFASSGGHFTRTDGLLLFGAVCCGIGYAEGARVGKEIGPLAASCWVPILAAPLAIALSWRHQPADWGTISPQVWMAFAYNGLFSVWLGFVFWYRGLARGGVARVGQLQLLQPVFTLLLVVLFFHEPTTLQDWMAAAAVLVCVTLAQAWARKGDAKAEPAGGARSAQPRRLNRSMSGRASM